MGITKLGLLIADLHRRTFSKSFDSSSACDWKLKLEEVHAWLWQKWSVVKTDEKRYPLKPEKEQEAGLIKDEDILLALEHIVSQLPSKTKYPRTQR